MDVAGKEVVLTRAGGVGGGHRLTMRDVLGLEVMRGASVLAGASGLDREVRGINIIEVPDVWQWLEGGELLLTAGYAWRDDPEHILDVTRRLERLGISGIAVKLGRYLDRVPEAVLRHADETGLVVVQLPADVAYREILESLYGRLTDRPALSDHHARAKRALIHFSLDEQSVDKVTGALARELASEVYVLDLLDEEVVAAAADGATRRTPLDAAEGRLAAVRALDVRRLRRSPAALDFDGARALGAALVVSHRPQGAIVALAGDERDEGAPSAIAHAGELVSFLLMKRMAVLEGRREAAGLFLGSLMADELSNEEAAERALTLGLRLTRPCVVLVIGSLTGALASEAVPVLSRDLDRALAGTPHVLAPERGSGVLLGLLQVDEQDETALLSRLLASVRARADEEGWGAPVLGSGTPRTGLDGVRRSRSEALIAYETAARLRQPGLVRFADLGVERLLAQIPREPLAEDYVRSLLGPLEDEPELLRTVEVYLQQGGNKVATAAAIPLHRSSLVYRLQKASALLGFDLDSPERRLELWFAIRLRRILALP